MTSIKGTVAAVAMSALIPATLAGQNRCEYRDVIELSAARSGTLTIDAGSGKLEIEGRSGAGDVEVTADPRWAATSCDSRPRSCHP